MSPRVAQGRSWLHCMPRTIGQKRIGELSVLSLLLENAAAHGNRWHLHEHTLTEQPERAGPGPDTSKTEVPLFTPLSIPL